MIALFLVAIDSCFEHLHQWSGGSISSVERQPEHKEENSSDHCNHLRVVFALAPVFLISIGLSVVEKIACSKSKAYSRGFFVHRASHIDSAELASPDGLI